MALKLPARKLITPKIIRPAKPAVQAPARSGQTAGYSPSDGFARARTINEERQRNYELRQNRPFEFNMKPGEGGMNGVTIILVDRPRLPAMPYFHYMHRWGFEQGEPKTEVCLQDGPEGCGLCRSLNRKGGYEMALTCIDTRPFTYKNGPNAGKTLPRSKRPYPVKTSMIPAFERLYKQHKTFRGMVLKCFRDGPKSPATGSQVEFVRMLSEAEVVKYGDLAVPLDYTKAYPRLTNAKLAEIYGLDTSDGALGTADFAKAASSDELPF